MFEKAYKNASIEVKRSRSCDGGNENITLLCQRDNSRGICIWKRANKSINAYKRSYCDRRMCCLNIRNFAKEDAGPYTCFMYFDALKADVVIPQPDRNRCSNPGGLLDSAYRQEK